MSHTGKVVSSNPDFTEVQIMRSDACSECRAKELCGVQGKESSVVTVRTDPFNIHDAGDEVQVCMKPSMGAKAVWISYVIPLFVLLAVMLALSMCHVAELWCGLGGIAGVVLYYIVLSFFRGKLENEFEFYLK